MWAAQKAICLLWFFQIPSFTFYCHKKDKTLKKSGKWTGCFLNSFPLLLAKMWWFSGGGKIGSRFNLLSHIIHQLIQETWNCWLFFHNEANWQSFCCVFSIEKNFGLKYNYFVLHASGWGLVNTRDDDEVRAGSNFCT